MTRLATVINKIIDIINTKQPALVSGENIKKLNGTDIVGSGNIPVKTVGGESILGDGNVGVKTINGETMIGSGDAEIVGTGTLSTTAQNIIGAINELDTDKAEQSDLTALTGRVGTAETDIVALDGRVTQAEAAVGTPLVASTVAGMTDNTKIYVYTGSETGYTSGNWYYWNGTAWTSGGVYNSTAFETDTTLALSGKAADAKIVGDELTDVKSDISNITQVHYGKNRLDIHAPFIDGYFDASGNLVQDERWKTCDYCYVEGADELTFSYESGGARYNGTYLYICTYTADKTFIERLSNQTVSPIQIGQNVAYVRWSFNYTLSDSSKLMLEKGGTITTYEPFNDYLYIKTDDTLTEPNMPADSYAVGERLKHIQDVLDYSQATLTMTGERLLNAHTGAITVSAGNTGWKVSDYAEIQSSSRVIVKTQHFWGQGLYAFYDENKNYISGLASEPGGTVTRLYDVVVETPSNAKYIIIGFLGGDRMEVPALFIGTKQNALPSQRWSGKKWACIGDSLTESYGVTEIHYFEYIRALTGIETVNLGSSGNGYATNGGNFMIKAQQVPSDADLVTIFGSGNDASSGLSLGDASDTGTSTIAGCINTAIDNVFNVNPIVPLGIVTPTPWVNDMPYDDGWMEQYSELIVNICRLRSIPCLDLFHCSNLNPNSAAVRSAAYSKDNGGGVHPNEAGHRIIAAHFKGFLDSLII